MVHVKVIRKNSADSLEEAINKFLLTIEEQSIIDIKLISSRAGRDASDFDEYLAMIVLR